MSALESTSKAKSDRKKKFLPKDLTITLNDLSEVGRKEIAPPEVASARESVKKTKKKEEPRRPASARGSQSQIISPGRERPMTTDNKDNSLPSETRDGTSSLAVSGGVSVDGVSPRSSKASSSRETIHQCRDSLAALLLNVPHPLPDSPDELKAIITVLTSGISRIKTDMSVKKSSSRSAGFRTLTRMINTSDGASKTPGEEPTQPTEVHQSSSRLSRFSKILSPKDTSFSSTTEEPGFMSTHSHSTIKNLTKKTKNITRMSISGRPKAEKPKKDQVVSKMNTEQHKRLVEYENLAMRMLHPVGGVPLKDHRKLLNVFKHSTSGTALLDWMVTNLPDDNGPRSRDDIKELANQLLINGLIIDNSPNSSTSEVQDKKDVFYTFKEGLDERVMDMVQISTPIFSKAPSTDQDLECDISDEVEFADEDFSAMDEDTQSSLKHRKNALRELIVTEKEYINDVKTLIKVYYKPMTGNGPFASVLEEGQTDVVFSNISMILPVNLELLKSLKKEATKPAEQQNIGEVFLQLVNYLKIYKFYCSSQETQMDLVDKLTKTNPSFAVFTQEMKKRPECRSLDISSFLIKPTQRLCKYPLLIRELLRSTPKEFPDYAKLEKAHLAVQEVVQGVNETKRLVERQQKVVKYQNMIETDEGQPEFVLVSPKRFFLAKATFKTPSKGAMVSRLVILFNDIVLVTRKPTKGVLKVITLFDLADSVVWEVPDGTEEEGLKLKNCFSLLPSAKSAGIKVTLSANSATQKREWIDMITEQQAAISVQ